MIHSYDTNSQNLRLHSVHQKVKFLIKNLNSDHFLAACMKCHGEGLTHLRAS